MKPIAAGLNHVLSTPVWNLLRGRIGPCPTYQEVIAAARLPAALADMVLCVVRRTRLWAREKAQVAGELVAHFQDGLEAGRTGNELLASFGNVKQVARLIRRAKLRSRPMAWKLVHGLKRAAQLVFALAILVYAVQAFRLYSHSVNVGRNFVAEWNAPVLAIPEAERAWPIYRAAMLRRAPKVPKYEDSDLTPDSPRLGELKTYIADNQPAVELCRQAAAMPKLGAVLEAAIDEELEQSLELPKRRPAPPIPADSLSMVQPPHYAALYEVTYLLELDARIAAGTGDAGRAAADISALSGVSDHAFQVRTFLGDLVGLAVAHRTCRVVKSTLHECPSLLADEQLTRLSHRLTTLAGGPEVHLNLAYEYALLDDFLQRYYTDDGHGDGLPTVGIRTGELGGIVALPYPKALTPAFTITMPGRRSTREQVRQLLARSEAEGRVPLWERGASQVEAEVKQYASSTWNRMHYAPIAGLFQSYSPFFLQCDYFMQNRDATLVAIALELYRRHTGHWPAALEELMPQYLPQVPLDRYDGRPIKYRLVDGQPLLYSVGVDRVDDGGRLPEPKAGDEKRSRRNSAARRWQPPGTADVIRGDWILWPPVEG